MDFKSWSKNELKTWIKMMERMPFFNSEEDNKNIEKAKQELKR